MGAIADDLTGATDLASALSRGGLSVMVAVGLPASPDVDSDALIISLKIRSAEIREAVRAADRAASILERGGAPRLYFKYSSTFDSGETGNIGPVSDALLERTHGDLAVVCPAFPRLDRTVYQGHLFVGPHLLDRAGLGDHPLTPRRESSVVSLMRRQTPHPVGLVPLQVVRRGAAAVVNAFGELQAQGIRFAVTDAADDTDLASVAAACLSHELSTGSAGLAGAMAPFIRHAGPPRPPDDWNPQHVGWPVILSGSCSETTRRQIGQFARHGPVLRLDPDRLSPESAGDAVTWALHRLRRSAVLIYSATDDGFDAAEDPGTSKIIESVLGSIARQLGEAGVRRFVVAGGETSGAVVQALGVRLLKLGPELSPGVSWMADQEGRGIVIALKSGNFGDAELFVRAASMSRSA